MRMMPQLVASSVPSPCRNICKVARGICTGCGRTLDEIAAWPTAPDPERRAIVARAGDRIRKPEVKRGLGAAGGSR
jgi:predicted Fe-S protein YdhL (DUF1289 family)